MTAVQDVARLLTLVPWLLERPGASVAEIAATFGVSQDRVLKDLYHLDFCGLPGLGGGALFDVTIIDGRVLVEMADELRRPLRLTPREALRLVLTVEAVAEVFGHDVPALSRAAAKVRAAAGVPGGVAVELATEGGRWLGPVRRAISQSRRLRLIYQGRNDPEPLPRTVEPWRVRIAAGTLYLEAFDPTAQAPRTFRLDRVAAVEVLEEPASTDAPEDPLPPPRYVAGPHDTEVELRLGPRARWLAEAVEPDAVEVDGDDLRVRLHTDAQPWIERLILMGGEDVTVVRPAALARSVRQRARAALDHYE